jgi:hypothetical protein
MSSWKRNQIPEPGKSSTKGQYNAKGREFSDDSGHQERLPASYEHRVRGHDRLPIHGHEIPH